MSLYRIAAAAALASAIFIPVQVAVFLVWPPPLDGTAQDWFTLLRDNRLAGLADLDLLLVADNVLLIPVMLALFIALRHVNPSLTTIAAGFGFAGIAMYIATNPAVQMAALSDQYFAAATDTEGAAVTAAALPRSRMWSAVTGEPG